MHHPSGWKSTHSLGGSVFRLVFFFDQGGVSIYIGAPLVYNHSSCVIALCYPGSTGVYLRADSEAFFCSTKAKHQ